MGRDAKCWPHRDLAADACAAGGVGAVWLPRPWGQSLVPEASWRLRSRAASRAAMRAARTPWFSSSRMALMVVPAGDVTFSRSFTGCSPLSRSIVAAPIADWTIRSWALSRGRPSRMPAVRHGFDQVEEVCRSGAGEGGAGVLLGLRDAERLADGAEDLLGVREVVTGGVGAAWRSRTWPRRPGRGCWS